MNDIRSPRDFAASDISAGSIMPACQTTLLAQVTEHLLSTRAMVNDKYNHNDHCSSNGSQDYMLVKCALTEVFRGKNN